MVTYVTHFSYLIDGQKGIIKTTINNLPDKSPSYGQICIGINRLNVNITNDITDNTDVVDVLVRSTS